MHVHVYNHLLANTYNVTRSNLCMFLASKLESHPLGIASYRILLVNSCGYYKFQVEIGAVTN